MSNKINEEVSSRVHNQRFPFFEIVNKALPTAHKQLSYSILKESPIKQIEDTSI